MPETTPARPYTLGAGVLPLAELARKACDALQVYFESYPSQPTAEFGQEAGQQQQQKC